MSARRSWMLPVAGLALALLAGCPEELKQKPQLRVVFNPNPFDYGKIYVGASRQSSIALTNKGLEDLVVSTVTLSGDPVFTKFRPADGSPNPTVLPDAGAVPSGALTLVPANRSSYLSLLFTPTADRNYSGNVNIASNAENAPSQDIPMVGIGCAPPLADGGQPPGSICN